MVEGKEIIPVVAYDGGLQSRPYTVDVNLERLRQLYTLAGMSEDKMALTRLSLKPGLPQKDEMKSKPDQDIYFYTDPFPQRRKSDVKDEVDADQLASVLNSQLASIIYLYTHREDFNGITRKLGIANLATDIAAFVASFAAAGMVTRFENLLEVGMGLLVAKTIASKYDAFFSNFIVNKILATRKNKVDLYEKAAQEVLPVITLYQRNESI
jgi:hypothetical protein